jgi:hypothetical protein
MTCPFERLIIENPEILSECVIPYLDDALSFCRFSLLSREIWAFVQSHIATHPDTVSQTDEGWYVLGAHHGIYNIWTTERRVKCSYINGRRHGKMYKTRTRANFNYITIAYYEHGSLHGPYIKKNNKNSEQTISNHSGGVLHGTYSRYSESGTLWLTCNYIDGFLEGKYCVYYDTKFSTLQSLTKYKRGMRHGKSLKFRRDATIKSRECYKNGKLITTREN